jgi:hypothetical protein
MVHNTVGPPRKLGRKSEVRLRQLPGLFRGPDEELVDGDTPRTRDDVCDRVGDIARFERLD